MARAASPDTDFDLGTLTELRSSRTEPASEPALPERLGERYRVQALLGQGGMAAVYRAEDAVDGRTLAIKQLAHAPDTREGRELCALFEREFHLLMQLSHPRVIEVYDYGVDGGRPYYTMELLDGGDLRELSPLPWRRACELIYDVCSSLALLHSRRFVHRDISPRNVRCTRAGFAKLIDFGAAVPMGLAPHVVGTAACVPPEAMSRGMLDARADLYSLGVTCYFALTGALPFDVRQLNELNDAWLRVPFAPSALVPELPPALDELVMSLISLEPAQRPRSAYEVMQRLSAIAGLQRTESIEVPRAYLSAPSTVGRDAELTLLRAKIAAAVRGGGSATLLAAPSGGGRSHMLDACAIAGKTLGAAVLRMAPDPSGRKFAVAESALEQLLERAPHRTLAAAQEQQVRSTLFRTPQPMAAKHHASAVLRDLSALSEEPAFTRDALERLLRACSQDQPLLLVVDDVHDVDDASLALLTALAQHCGQLRMALLFAADSGGSARAPVAFEVLCGYCQTLTLPALGLEASGALISSLFGDVPNVALVSHHIYQLARGNPGATLRLAQWLVERGAICYAGGGWTLPQQLSASDLPSSHEQTVADQLTRLSPLARALAEAQALAVSGVFTRDDYARLAQAHASAGGAGATERALLELVSAGVLASDGRTYKLARRELRQPLMAAVSDDQRLRHHRVLAQHFLAPGVPLVFAVSHLLASGQEPAALQRVLQYYRAEDEAQHDIVNQYTPALPFEVLSELYGACLRCAERLQLAPRALAEMRRRIVLVSVVDERADYARTAPAWLEQLRQDSGLAHWQALPAELPAGDRLVQAYSAAQRVYDETPEAARGYRPDEAIRALAQYAVLSIVIAAREFDRKLVMSLPALLEPFAPVSPLVDALWHNVLATCENLAAQYLQATARWLRVYNDLGQHTGELPHVTSIRNAIAFGIGSIEASLGIASAERWARTLDGDPMQRVNAMYLRKIGALQQGDWEAADKYRKQAELLAVHANMRQMFGTLLPTELSAHAMAGDLAGVKHVAERIALFAERYPHWLSFAQLAQGQFQRLRGDLAEAQRALEACIAGCDPRVHGSVATMMAFCPAAAAYVEVLIDVGEHARALAWGSEALTTLHALGVDAASWELERALALAEAKDPKRTFAAAERLERVLHAQRELGVAGLHLGATYEARTRVAIAAWDDAAIVEYAQLTAAAYRHGLGSLLGARYERLREEARRAGVELSS